MAINFDKYKTYDTSKGFGNRNEWRKNFSERMGMDEAERIINNQAETPYQVLGVTPSSTQAEIKKAFRRLITEWHPDKNEHRSELAEEMSKKIIAAYTILTNK